MPALEQFGVILFTLRDHLKTREDALATFRKIADIGYKTVQISGMSQDLFSEEELIEELAKVGLHACATHEPGDAILNKTDAVISRLQKLGVRLTAYPFPGGIDFADPQAIATWIGQLDRAGQQLAEAGITLMYHNHAHEFFKSEGKTVMERIYDQTDPRHLQGEPDTFWIQAGGQSPLAWMERLAGRLPVLHMKDFKVNPQGERTFAEIGQGNLDFPAIVQAAEKSGCQYYIVEQDSCPGDPFDSIKISFDYICENLVTV